MNYDWFYKGKLFKEEMIGDFVGFVYIVTCIPLGKSYIGKKNFTKSKIFQKNKKKKRKRISSDWINYFGSSAELQSEMQKYGKKKFRRQIIRLCRSKAEMNYYELKEQVERDVLLKPNEYYNSYVGTRIHRNHLKHLFA